MMTDNRLVISKRLVVLYSLAYYLDKSATALIADVPGGFFERVLSWQDWGIQRVSSRALMEEYGLWVETDSLSAVNVLAEEPGVLEYAGAIQAGLANVPPRRVGLRCVSVDRAYGHMKRLGLLFLNDAQVLGILKGAAHTIAHKRPVLVIPRSRATLENMTSWAEANDYRLFSVKLSPCDYILVPSSEAWLEQACEVAVYDGELDSLALPPEVLARANELGLKSIERLVQQARGELSVSLQTQRFSLPLRSDWSSRAWYGGEGDDDYSWRWSGPAKDSVVLLPVPAPGKYHLSLQVLYHVNERLSGTGQLFINGYYVGVLPEGESLLEFQVSELGFNGFAEVQLSFPETIQPSEHDVRELAVALGSIAVTWEGL